MIGTGLSDLLVSLRKDVWRWVDGLPWDESSAPTAPEWCWYAYPGDAARKVFAKLGVMRLDSTALIVNKGLDDVHTHGLSFAAECRKLAPPDGTDCWQQLGLGQTSALLLEAESGSEMREVFDLYFELMEAQGEFGTDIENILEAIGGVDARAAEGEISTSGAGDDGYIPAGKIGWEVRFTGRKQFMSFLNNTPQIKQRHPRKNRLEVHAADWLKYWVEHDAKQFESLDVSSDVVANAVRESKRRKRQVPRPNLGK